MSAVSRAAAVIVALGGGYITHIHPRCLAVEWNDGPGGPRPLVLRGWVLVLLDCVFHQLPLLLLWWAWWRHRGQPFLTAAGMASATALFVLYLQWQDLPRVRARSAGPASRNTGTACGPGRPAAPQAAGRRCDQWAIAGACAAAFVALGHQTGL